MAGDALSREDQIMRQGFKYFNRAMLLNWRLGLGPIMSAAPQIMGRYMVITHVGRKSGLIRRTPLNFAPVGDVVYCVAGFGHIADWYRNIMANPEIEVWLPDGRWQAHADDVTDSEDSLSLIRQVLINSGFAAAFAGVNPHSIDDDTLKAETQGYRLVRLTLLKRLEGEGGPGDLAWVWPVAGAVGVMLAALRTLSALVRVSRGRKTRR